MTGSVGYKPNQRSETVEPLIFLFNPRIQQIAECFNRLSILSFVMTTDIVGLTDGFFANDLDYARA